MGEEYDRIRRNKRHKYKNNEYVEGYVPGKKIREIVELEGDIIISNPIIVNQVVRPQGVQIIQNLAPRVTSAEGDYASDDQVYRIPTPGTYFIVILNGRVIQPARDVSEISTAAAYFVSPDGALRPQGEVVLGDKLKWNGDCAGVQIEADDELVIVYEVAEALPVGVKYMQTLAPVVTVADGDPITYDTISKSPVAGTTVVLTLNGRVITPANGPGEVSVSAFYIESPIGQVRAHGQAQLGDKLLWNGSVAGTQIQLTDELILIYEI